jgi:predicted O-methyltransferase YrrM
MNQSSYKKAELNYGHFFQFLIGFHKPKVIVEFGILEGFSLMNMVVAGNNLPKEPNITAYDIFEKFNGNHAKPEIIEKFKNYQNVSIKEGDFFKIYKEIPNNSIDIIHIDIENTGDVYKFAVENYLNKLTLGGFMILEGGSVERDSIDWMSKYEKSKIRDFLEHHHTYNFEYITISIFPSITIIKNKV